MNESLKQKIRQLAQDYKLAKFISEGANSEAFSNFIRKEELVPVDDVLVLLGKATEQIEQIFKDTEERVGDLRVLSVIRGDLKPAILVLLGVEGETKK